MYIFQVLEYFHFCYFTYWRLFNDVYLPATWKGKHEIQWSLCFGPGFRNEERKSEKHLLNNILLLIFLSRLSLGLCSRCRCELSASETLDRCRVWSPARPLCLHLLSPQSLCDLKALCWCEKAVVVSCRPAWRPPASPIHPRAFPGGCLCVECSTPWSLEPNGVWERGLGFFSLCSAVQTCCHTAERDDSPESPLHLYFCLSVCYTSVYLSACLSALFTVCLLHSLSHCPSFFPSLSFPPSFLLPFNHSFTFPSLPSFLPYFPSPPFLPPCLLSFPSYLVLSSLISPTFVFLPSSVSLPAFPSFLISFP